MDYDVISGEYKVLRNGKQIKMSFPGDSRPASFAAGKRVLVGEYQGIDFDTGAPKIGTVPLNGIVVSNKPNPDRPGSRLLTLEKV